MEFLKFYKILWDLIYKIIRCCIFQKTIYSWVGKTLLYILVNQRYSRQHLNKGLNLNGSYLSIRFMNSKVVVLVRFMNNEVVGYLESAQNYVIYIYIYIWLLRVRPKLCNIYIYIYIYMVHLKLIKNERSIGFDWLLQPYVNKKERCKKVAQFVGQPSHDIFFSLPKPRP